MVGTTLIIMMFLNPLVEISINPVEVLEVQGMIMRSHSPSIMSTLFPILQGEISINLAEAPVVQVMITRNRSPSTMSMLFLIPLVGINISLAEMLVVLSLK
jgi:hypothetical protein